MHIQLQVSVRAKTLHEAVEKIGFQQAEVVGQPSVVITGGAGTELKNLIGRFGLKPGLNCKCGQHIREMDKEGTDWCYENIQTITGWLREEAQRAKLPFTEIGAKLLIKRAISNARKKQKENQDMIVDMKVEIETDDVYDAMTRTKPKEGKVLAIRCEPPRSTTTGTTQPTGAARSST